MWAMSDRGIPRSYRTMEGFGIHTFRLINAEGKATFVRFHWKPLAGKASLVWDEAQKLTGRDPDFHRRELWEAIESKAIFRNTNWCFQLIPEEDEFEVRLRSSRSYQTYPGRTGARSACRQNGAQSQPG
ncbi:catalase [Escherichia coli]